PARVKLGGRLGGVPSGLGKAGPDMAATVYPRTITATACRAAAIPAGKAAAPGPKAPIAERVTYCIPIEVSLPFYRQAIGEGVDGKLEVPQGTLALMVLKTLQTMGPLHGYGIARRIEQTSGDLLTINYGTLYPALVRLEQEG